MRNRMSNLPARVSTNTAPLKQSLECFPAWFTDNAVSLHVAYNVVLHKANTSALPKHGKTHWVNILHKNGEILCKLRPEVSRSPSSFSHKIVGDSDLCKKKHKKKHNKHENAFKLLFNSNRLGCWSAEEVEITDCNTRATKSHFKYRKLLWCWSPLRLGRYYVQH